MPTATAPKWAYDGSRSTEREVAEFLAGLIRVTKPAVVVETGTFLGTTTKRLAAALVVNEYGHLWTVENDPELASKYAEMELGRTTFVNADSLAWAIKDSPVEIDLGFVDCGEPTHRLAVLDFLRHSIAPGGFIALHDHIFYDDLKEDAEEIMHSPASLTIPAVNGLLVWQV